MIRFDVFGWFDDPAAESPAHDPGMDAVCPACGKGLGRPVKTISLMPEGGDRSYFFRVHKGCWEALEAKDREAIESSLIDAAIQPLYPHDCNRCVFLGRFDDPHDGPCDLYACQCACGCNRINLIAREHADRYRSWIVGLGYEGSDSIREAERRARSRRLFGLSPGN